MIHKQAFAKINLALDVLRARPDGMHDVDLILTPLALHDNLTFELLTDTTEIRLTAPTFLGQIQHNLIFQAAKLLQQRFCVKQGVSIILDKQIPVAAGLAGGSSDGAVTLQALVELWQLQVSEGKLHELAALLGADVPYCLYQQTIRARGMGEQLTRVPEIMKTTVVLFKPKDYGIAAGDAYTYVDEAQAFSHGHVQPVIDALAKQNYLAICDSLYNCFEPVLFARFPDLARHRRAIGEIADAVLLSGSGPTLFAFAQETAQIVRLMEYGATKELQTIQTETK